VSISINYTFAIDTSDYAGNFERCLYAYVTGMPYEYYNRDAERLRELRHEETPCVDYSEYIEARAGISSEEHGIAEFGIEPTPNTKGCNTVVFFLSKKPPQEVLDKWKRRAQELIDRFPELERAEPEIFKFTQLPKKILGFRLVTNTVTTSEQIL